MKPFKGWPTKAQWRQFLKILNKKEKIIFSIFLLGVIYSFSFLLVHFYLENTQIQPTRGGVYSEGLIGQPRFLNPIYAQARDVDRDLVELLFSGLLTYGPDGQLLPELAKEYYILEEGETYEFHLKEELFWEDGTPLTVEDVIFTIETIQNPDFKSPLRVNWLGVKVEKISEDTVRFKLKKSSSVFLENCTLKIIPKHIWGSISPENFPLTFYNLQPIGSGPYKLEELVQDEEKIASLKLVENPNYFERGPFIPQITFYFFDTEEDLIKSLQRREIKGLSLNSVGNLSYNAGLNLHAISSPRYFALFFNLEESEALSDLEVRKALNYAIDREGLIREVLSGHGEIVNSPIIPQVYNFTGPSEIYSFDLEKAKIILDEAGFLENVTGIREKVVTKKASFQLKSNLKVGSQGTEVKELQKCLAQFPDVYPEGEVTGYFGALTKKAVINFQEKYKEEILAPYSLEEGTGQVKSSTRAKLNELCFTKKETVPLELSLTTVDQPLLTNTASIVKNQWEKLGVGLTIETFQASELEREIIKKREYEILLFGEVLGSIPDPFPFWHSSQKRDPGLNLSLYSNKKCDQLLEEARESLDPEIRREKLKQFQEEVLQDAPAVFLYSPAYLYLVDPEIQGITTSMIVDPSKRFCDAENWYIKTKRAWK